MQHHNRIAARIPDDAQHFQIAVAALEHIEHMRLAAAIFNANARVLIAVKIRPGQFAFGPWQDIKARQPLSAGSVRAGGVGGADQTEELGAPRAQVLD
jgi:hypothetical protein